MLTALVNPHIFPADFRGDESWNSNRSLNFGLLSIATYLHRKKMPVVIWDLQGEKDPLKLFESLMLKEKPGLVGIGCVSALSYLPTLDLAARAKACDPDAVVAVGGQHTRFIARHILAQTRSIDAVALAEGESTVEQLALSVGGSKGLAGVGGISFMHGGRLVSTEHPAPVPWEDISPICFELYPNYRQFFPVIEDSRGCPCRCAFCSNERVFDSRIRYKPPALILRDLEEVLRAYGSHSLPLIFYNSIYGMNGRWARNVLAEIRRAGIQIRFMTSTRVDGPWRCYVDELAGLCDQMRFGLESGSPEILLRMKKTEDPKRYLDQARAALRAFAEQGVHVGLNILTGFCGEDSATLGETFRFVEENAEWIHSVRSHPLMLFPGSPFNQDMTRFAGEFGTSLALNRYSARIHAYPVNPSRSLSFDDSVEEGRRLMQKFNSFSRFYGYYKWLVGPVKRDQTIDFISQKEFASLLKGIDPRSFDFNSDEAGLPAAQG